MSQTIDEVGVCAVVGVDAEGLATPLVEGSVCEEEGKKESDEGDGPDLKYFGREGS